SAEHVFGFLAGAVVSGMIYLGDRMGLYRMMSGAGPLTSEDLARRTGLHERWVREWLYGQAAANLIDYKGESRFELSPRARPSWPMRAALCFWPVVFVPCRRRWRCSTCSLNRSKAGWD